MSLLQYMQDGPHAGAWESFVDRYSPLVYGYCRQRGIQEADARDIMQNVFLAVSRGMHTFQYDPARGRFRSWLGTITCREIRRYLSWENRLRKKFEDGELAETEHVRQLESEWSTHVSVHLFQEAARQVQSALPADTWSAFELTWLKSEPAADVAARLGRPIAWVYKAKFRGLKRLRAEVEKLADDAPLHLR